MVVLHTPIILVLEMMKFEDINVFLKGLIENSVHVKMMKY